MSAETLRRAAALMRERAEAATPGPWEAYRTRTGCGVVPGGAPRRTGPGGARRLSWQQDWAPEGAPVTPDAEHIASWHPAVALAVADMLDHAAWFTDAAGTVDDEALAVARAYLGADA